MRNHESRPETKGYSGMGNLRKASEAQPRGSRPDMEGRKSKVSKVMGHLMGHFSWAVIGNGKSKLEDRR